MKNKTYFFAGNRFSALEAMLKAGVTFSVIAAPKDSWLARELDKRHIAYTVMENKIQLCELIAASAFDVLVSNGCPYILPVSKLQKPHQLFVNLHPSYLPNLRGIHPVNGALWLGLSGGASCHIMDDGIDTGAIICRKEIPLTETIDLAQLYQLSFSAEAEMAIEGLKREFKPDTAIELNPPGLVVYKRKTEDMRIDFNEPAEMILRRIRAFGVASQGAFFERSGERYKVLAAKKINSPKPASDAKTECIITQCSGETIVIRKNGELLELKPVLGDVSKLAVGERL